MTGPDWFRWTITVLFLAVAAYCVARLAKARHVPELYRGCHRSTDVAHCLMSAGMGVMCSPVGGPVPVAGWQTVFLLITSWFGWSWYRERHTRAASAPIGWHGSGLHHAVAGLAMVYMLFAMPGDGHHTAAPWVPGMADTELALPLVAWLFAGYFLVHATLLGSALVRPGAPDSRLPAMLTAPRLTASCQVFMALAATYMLVG